MGGSVALHPDALPGADGGLGTQFFKAARDGQGRGVGSHRPNGSSQILWDSRWLLPNAGVLRNLVSTGFCTVRLWDSTRATKPGAKQESTRS